MPIDDLISKSTHCSNFKLPEKEDYEFLVTAYDLLTKGFHVERGEKTIITTWNKEKQELKRHELVKELPFKDLKLGIPDFIEEDSYKIKPLLPILHGIES